MLLISPTSSISCRFDSNHYPSLSCKVSDVEIFFAQTKYLHSKLSYLKNYLTDDERLRADMFYFKEDKETYIACHALLRIILSRKLSRKPSEISFLKGKYNKPYLKDHPINFNITRTRDAFAFIISLKKNVGIDLEKNDNSFDFNPIIDTYFTEKEREYILESEFHARSRFFLLWTLKESLLKALGTGMIKDFLCFEIYEPREFIIEKSLQSFIPKTIIHNHFICSIKFLNYYLSIALAQEAKVILNHISGENINAYID